MAAGKCKQFILLLCKNFTIRRKRPWKHVGNIVFLMDIFGLVVLSIVVVGCRLMSVIHHESDVTTWESFDVDELPDEARYMYMPENSGGSSSHKHHAYQKYVSNNSLSDAVNAVSSSNSQNGAAQKHTDSYTNRGRQARSLVFAPDTPLTLEIMTSVRSRLQLSRAGAWLV